jgi:hypothetical protein
LLSETPDQSEAMNTWSAAALNLNLARKSKESVLTYKLTTKHHGCLGMLLEN